MSDLQTINNQDYHKNFANNQLKAHNKIANFIKWVVQATGNKLEKIGSYIRHLGKAHQGPSLAERSISVRVNSATDMHDNNYLMLGSNKNFRAHRNSLDLIYEKHPDVDAIVPCGNGEGWYSNSTYKCYNKLPEEAKNKFIETNILYQKRNKWVYREFNCSDDVDQMVNSMFNDIVAKKGEHFSSDDCKEIKLIVETPPFKTTKKTEGGDCAYEYITACEAWMLHMQTVYNKKVTILSFRSPENLIEHKTNNNNNYDNANTTIATKTKKDRESDLTSYIENYKLNQTKLKTEPALDNTTPEQGDNNDQQSQKLDNTSVPQPKQPDNTSDPQPKQPDNTSKSLDAPANDIKPKSEGDVGKTTTDILSALTFTGSFKPKDFTAATTNVVDQKMLSINCGFQHMVDNITINTNIGVEVCNLNQRADNLTNISLPEINNQDSFFLKDIISLNKDGNDGNELSYIYNLNFTDATVIDELPNIDSGLATIEYIGTVAKNIFDEKNAFDIINQGNIKNINIATNNEVNLSVVVKLHIPEEFDTAILNSQKPTINSLAKQHGSRALLLAAISLGETSRFRINGV